MLLLLLSTLFGVQECVVYGVCGVPSVVTSDTVRANATGLFAESESGETDWLGGSASLPNR